MYQKYKKILNIYDFLFFYLKFFLIAFRKALKIINNINLYVLVTLFSL